MQPDSRPLMARVLHRFPHMRLHAIKVHALLGEALARKTESRSHFEHRYK